MRTPLQVWESRPAPEAPDDLDELRAAIRSYLARGGQAMTPRQLSPLEQELARVGRARSEHP